MTDLGREKGGHQGKAKKVPSSGKEKFKNCRRREKKKRRK